MSRFTAETLAEYRKELKNRKTSSRGKIAVSLGTCGIAAGGDRIFESFRKELEDKHITDIELTRTGCLGMCFCEPNLLISVEGMPDVLYGYVTPEIVSRIIDEHIQKQYLVNNNVIFMPAKDLCKSLCK